MAIGTMMRKLFLCLLAILLVGCLEEKSNKSKDAAERENDFDEVFDLYSDQPPEKLYSSSVLDTFKIFKSLPIGYGSDSTARYPLILVLDANAYFESVVAEIKLGTLTQEFPKSIIVGIGYKDFWTMDSLRNRDYTSIGEKENPIGGGADKFKEFIDQQLLPKLKGDFEVDDKRIVIMGHSLGGYFVLHYLFSSYEKGEFRINNFISASPPLDGDEDISSVWRIS